MIAIDEALLALRMDIVRVVDFEKERLELNNSPLPAAMKDERDRDLMAEIERRRKRLATVLQELVAFPPQHVRHSKEIADFHAVADFDRSVFVMTKFVDPAKPTPEDAALKAVIDAVRAAVAAAGFTPRLASDKQFHPLLWDNVELYLLGCRRGIAIVEDKARTELNPNVAMEWGWMRGMGRDVLYLVETSFVSKRADWGGLIEQSFEWADPVPGISAAVAAWLKP